MYKIHISVLTFIKSTFVVHIRYACFSIFIKKKIQQKHVYLYIIDLFTGYDDDSKLNVTRDSNYYTMTWKSKIVKKKPKPMQNYHVALHGRVFITKRDCISAHAQSANRNERKITCKQTHISVAPPFKP